jgi:hypothetical protein
LPKYTIEQVQENFTEFDICASFLEGRDHHHYMTLERCASVSASSLSLSLFLVALRAAHTCACVPTDRYLESDGTLGHTRAFLYHELGLTHLFHGDGFTRTEDGKVGATLSSLARSRSTRS